MVNTVLHGGDAMNSPISATLAVLLLAGSPVLAAEPAEALAKSKQCLDCHAMDQATLAPSIKDIAGKYRNNAQAERVLVATVLKGSADIVGSRHWGTMKMPGQGARVEVSPDEAKQLVAWILAQK
jgi:cytochrome c